MGLAIRMKVIYNIKHRYAIRLKCGDKLLTFLINLVVGVKASICSAIKKICNFPAFFVVVII